MLELKLTAETFSKRTPRIGRTALVIVHSRLSVRNPGTVFGVENQAKGRRGQAP